MPKITFDQNDLLSGCYTLKARNKFSPGFDKMTPEAAETWLQINGSQLCNQLNGGKYKVMPASGFYMAKADGAYRRLARLTAIDTIIQLVLLDKLSDYCAENFSENSFAYQKGKGVASALNKYCTYAAQYGYASKIDLRSCFDSIDHTLLEKALNSFFFNRKIVSLLMAYAKMPVIIDGQLTDRNKGILQGAPISGMLCNIYFHQLDKDIEAHDIQFIRYGDDIVAFADSLTKADEYKEYVCSYIVQSLRLKTNASKCVTDACEKLKYLGQKFIRDKNGMICVGSGDKSASAYYSWNRNRPLNHRNSIDILSDGILRQKDYSAIFDSETRKTPIPLDTTDRINIFSNVIFDSGFLDKAMNAGIYINLFSKDYSYKGRFVPAGVMKDQRLVFEQLETYNNENHRLQLAKEFDLASVHNLRLNIRYYNKQQEEDVFKRALSSIDKLYDKMKQCTEYNRLLMTEAQIRGLYYSCFDSFIKNPAFTFKQRSKQPPLNEVNALISFGNVVLYNYIATELYKSPLDIRIGYLHATNRREESLNLDIAEIFKPLIIDRVVFSLINRNEINLSCFDYMDGGSVFLNEEGKRIFLRSFYEKLNSVLTVKDRPYSYAMLISSEIQKLVRHFRKGDKYKAYRQVR